MIKLSSMPSRLIRVAYNRYIYRGLPVPLDLGTRLMQYGVMVDYL